MILELNIWMIFYPSLSLIQPTVDEPSAQSKMIKLVDLGHCWQG